MATQPPYWNIKYIPKGKTTPSSTRIQAASEHEARQKIKSRYPECKIVSVLKG